MKKIAIKVLILLISFLLIFSIIYNSKATAITEMFGGKNVTTDKASKKIVSILAIVLEIVRNIGAGLALLMLLILGCKYMLASAGERAEIKKHAVTYVIGAVVLFAASGILEILKQFALSVTSV